jgi:hypothetical protein
MEFRAFAVSAIQSIVIPPFVKTISKSFFVGCLILSRATFQSGSHLQKIG